MGKKNRKKKKYHLMENHLSAFARQHTIEDTLFPF